MAPKAKQESQSANEIIRTAMRERGLTYKDVADQLGEKYPDKLAVAVRCSSGLGRRSIELRKRIAELLSLKPDDVWDEVHLTIRARKPTAGFSKAKFSWQWTDEEWATIPSRERIRSLLADIDLKLTDVAKILNIPYGTLTNAIYGKSTDDVRRRVAEVVERPIEMIWPDIYNQPASKVSLRKAIAVNPGLTMFLGFGDMTRSVKGRAWKPQQR